MDPREKIVYQIWPRSFCDGNGDGIGDLGGVIAKLDYLHELGVDLLWLSPVYASPNRDYGYDVSDYYAINQEYGTLAEFDRLVAEAKTRGIGILMDFVPNHTSDQHAWFRAALSDPNSPYRDFYYFRPGKNGGAPNNWMSFFGGSAWTQDKKTGEYYLTSFTPGPELGKPCGAAGDVQSHAILDGPGHRGLPHRRGERHQEGAWPAG